MGDFSVDIHIGNITGGDTRPVTALVDTGATERPMDYVLADGTALRCPRGLARISITVRSGETFSSICPVAFWPDESGQCIGATTLQILTLGVDPVNEELAPVSALRRGWAGDLPLQG